MEQALKPCPCGYTNYSPQLMARELCRDMNSRRWNHWQARIWCVGCGATIIEDNAAQVTEAWNRRASPEAQCNVAVEPVAVVERLKIIAAHRCSNDLGFDTEIGPLGCALEAQPGGSCFCAQVIPTVREAASSIASLSERLAAVITRLWPNGFGPQNIEELAVFIEEERRCDTEYRDELRAKLAEAREIIEPFAKQADAYDDDDQDHMADWPTFKVGDFRRARAFRDATSEGDAG